MDHDGRARLAETCGARDQSPSSNLGRVIQGNAIRVDDMDPQVEKGSREKREASISDVSSSVNRSLEGCSQEGC